MDPTKCESHIESITGQAEQEIEIAYAKEFLEIKGGNICEVGAVLRHWGVNTEHETID